MKIAAFFQSSNLSSYLGGGKKMFSAQNWVKVKSFLGFKVSLILNLNNIWLLTSGKAYSNFPILNF